MADHDNTGSFRTVAEDSELLHRPVQSFAVQGQAGFLGLCVRLHVVSAHTGEGWTLDLGQSCANTFPSEWFDKWRSDRDGSRDLKVRHVCKRIQIQAGRASDNPDARHLASIANEVRILANRSVRSSANIVALIPVSWCEAPDPQTDHFWPQLLLEQAELGTLDACFTQNNLPKPTKFLLYRDILDSLRYLHANGVVYGDLKPQNVPLSHDAAVDERYGLLPIKAKLCDFGYSVILSDYHQLLPFKAQMGTWPWPAPELDGTTSIPASLLPSTDVYSVGLLMVSIIRDGRTVFPGMSQAQVSAAKKQNTHVVLDCIFRELGRSCALGAPRGLSREQRGKVFMLAVKAVDPTPGNRVGIDGLILGWDEVLRLGIVESHGWRGTECSAAEWSLALHEEFLQQRYPPNYQQTEELPRMDDPSAYSSLVSQRARDDGSTHSDIKLTPDILRDLERQAASDTTVLSTEAYFALAGCYINGSLADQDHAVTLAHLRRAAELKHPGAIGSLLGIQAALGETPSSLQGPDVSDATTSGWDADCCTALSVQLAGLVYFRLDGYLKTVAEMAILPRSLAWKSWREPAYNAYRSSPRGLADARYTLNLINEQRGTSPAAPSDADAVLRAADKHILGVFLSYILQLQTSPDPEHDYMAISFRQIFNATGGVGINGPVDEGYTVLQLAVLSGNQNAVSSAITLGVDLEAAGHTPGWTPLWLSVVTGQGAIARLLLDKGASPDCRDTGSEATLLHLQVGEKGGCLVAFRQLLDVLDHVTVAEMAPLLPTSDLSLDDDINKARISSFRSRFQSLLQERVDLAQAEELLAAAEAGRWDVFPRDTYNGFYACIAWCRHAYRWATIPVVRLAQLEKTPPLPPALLQRHFGLTSRSGNNMSNLVLNFSPSGVYTLRINTGLAPRVTSSEESFARVFHDVERLALPVYHAVVHALLAHARADLPACLAHARRVTAVLRPLLSSYYDRVHDARVARDVWLSYVQGFYGWGVGYEVQGGEDAAGEWVKFDGLSGNQVLLFMVLDAFWGLEPYLDEENQRRNVPEQQRRFCKVVERHSFRGRLGEEGVEGMIAREPGEIVKRLRLFRTAHRTRAKVYLSQPAPERLPMTAGKSLLKSGMEQSLEYLDEFMVGRLA